MAARKQLAVLILAAGLACVPAANAAEITVKPGNNAIQKAVNKADAGDKLLIKGGLYKEDVRITKRLKLVGEPGDRPVIDGECKTDIILDVQANGVTLKHLAARGAKRGPSDGYTVNFIGVGSGTATDLVLRETCNSNPAYYGVNVFQTGALDLNNLDISGGYIDAGIYVGSIGDVGSPDFLIEDNFTHKNNIGILIEDSVPGANIVVRDNKTTGNKTDGLSTPAGILVRRSDGGRYIGNVANDNGSYGIHLLDDGGNTSDDNVLNDNTTKRNGDDNFFDQGTGNCGIGNSFSLDPC